MNGIAVELSPRVTQVFDVVRNFSVNERIVLAKLLLDTIVAGDIEDAADWQSLGLKALEEDWDNPDDAIYDDWRMLYGVQPR